MVDLAARSAFAGCDLPLTLGGLVLAALPEAPCAMVIPRRGQAGALGLDLPGSGQWRDCPGRGRIAWAGLDQWMLWGPAGDLVASGSVTDQSDGWVGLALRGAGVGDVLARLVPLDPAALIPGHAARTQLHHVACLLLVTEGGVEVHVMRSFAATVAGDIADAIRAVVARRHLA